MPIPSFPCNAYRARLRSDMVTQLSFTQAPMLVSGCNTTTSTTSYSISWIRKSDFAKGITDDLFLSAIPSPTNGIKSSYQDVVGRFDSSMTQHDSS